MTEGTERYAPVVDFNKHIDENGFVRDLTAHDIYRELSLDFDFDSAEVIPEDPFAWFEIDEYVRRIELSERCPKPWHITQTRKGTIYTSSLFGKKYSGLLRRMMDTVVVDRANGEVERSLRYKIFRSAIEELRTEDVDFTVPEEFFSFSKTTNAQAENELVALIREKTQSKAYRDLQRFHEAQARKNYRSGEKFINHSFDTFSKLLIVRIDLGFKKKARDTNLLERAQTSIAKLWELRRRKEHERIFKFFVGYIRKLEYKPKKRYHFHLMLFFDGHWTRNGYYYAEEVGKLWVDVVTSGDGVFHNCNANQLGYRRCELA